MNEPLPWDMLTTFKPTTMKTKLSKTSISFLFLLLLITSTLRVQAAVEISADSSAAAKAQASIEKIEKDNAWVEHIDSNTIIQLPVGIMHTGDQNYGNSSGDNVEYAVGIIKAKFTTEYTILTVFARIRIPQTDGSGKKRELFFGADNIKLSHDGGIAGDARLVLLKDVSIPFNGGKWSLVLNGGTINKQGDIDAKSYVTINCDGVKDINIDGRVVFDRSILIPADPSTHCPTKGQVEGKVSINASSWNDLLAAISLPPFMLASQLDSANDPQGNNAFMFTMNQAVFDFSDKRNDPAVVFPKYYTDNNLLMPTVESWRGVYIKSLEVALPKLFHKRQNNEPISFGAHNLLIDNYGVSGDFSGDNLLTIEEGRTGIPSGWAYSLDHIGVSLAANHLTKASFTGKIIMPTSKVGALGYDGLISEEEYRLTVKLDTTIDFDLWKAEAHLYPNSSVEFAVKKGKFYPKATLNGSIDLGAFSSLATHDSSQTTHDTSLVAAKGIHFEGLVLQTVSPKISVKSMGYDGAIKLGPFPASISAIDVATDNQNASLKFTANVGLMDSGDKGFGTSGTFKLKAQYEEIEGRQHWKYAGVDIGTFAIKADLGAVKLKGNLMFRRNDPVYGDGFYANIDADINSIQIKADVVFGKKDFHYFYVDGAATGLKIQLSAITLSGFSGGVVYRMNRKAGGTGTSTGLDYIPNDQVALGVKASVTGSMIEDHVTSFEAGFEIATTSHGGVARLGFYGNATIMKGLSILDPLKSLNKKINVLVAKAGVGLESAISDKSMLDMAKESDGKGAPKGKELGDATIKAHIGLEEDFLNRVFQGELEVYINTNTPGAKLSGMGADGLAGKAIFYSADDATYLYIGTPDNPIGIKAGLGPIELKTESYFMAGSKILSSPPPPPKVAQILGVSTKELDYMHDENALKSGAGFGFGSRFEFTTGDITCLFLYAHFDAGAGFDLMLRNYGQAACSNNGGDLVGINGWYANGQAYAYLQGDMGIKVHLLFFTKKVSILKGDAALLVQAKGPNPFWMRGYLVGEYSVLNGLVSGAFRFKIEMGEKCDFSDSAPLGGIKIIESVAPNDGDKDVDVFAEPQATFAFKINEPFIIPEDDGDHTYRILLDTFTIKDAAGKIVAGQIELGKKGNTASFVPNEVLPPEQALKVHVSVSFQEKIHGGYKTLEVKGKKAVEMEDRKFTSGTAPTKIPLKNVEYMYPVLDQHYFYTQENGRKAYLQLRKGQSYLFDQAKWKSSILLTPANGGEASTVNFVYDSANKRINYQLPALSKEEQYHLSIVSKAVGAVSSNNLQTVVTKTSYDDNNTAEIKSTQANLGVNAANSQIERLGYDFSTSKYETFAKKVNSYTSQNNYWHKIFSDVISITSDIKSNEPFDLAELEGTVFTEGIPLVGARATLSDNYFKLDIAPIIYTKYPILPSFHLDRETAGDSLGIPPIHALPLRSTYTTLLHNNTNENSLKTMFPFSYNLPYYYKKDWIDLVTKAANYHVERNNPSAVIDLLNSNYKFMRSGKYEVELQYHFPGGGLGTKGHFDLKNPLNFRPE